VKNYLALICARGGSKGIPNKNLHLLGGKPLIVWSIELAKRIECISKVVVSTDSKDIAAVALHHGAEVPFLRPSELAQDNSAEWGVWRHAIEYYKNSGDYCFDGLVVIPPTAPLRNDDDIIRCLKEYENDEADIIITISPSHRSPYFNMVKIEERGNSSLVMKSMKEICRRQDSPEVFDMTTVAYVVNPEFVLQKNGIFEGQVRSVHVPRERAIDIDTPFDLKVAECLIKQNEENM